MKAIWNDIVIADSDETKNIEGNHYFPPDSIKNKFFQESDFHTVCPWKGTASYFHVNVEGSLNENAAWYYPETKPAADSIKGYIAFWRGVEVKED